MHYSWYNWNILNNKSFSVNENRSHDIIFENELTDMNKKILIGIAIALVVVAVGIVGVKTMLGDAKTELPYEEQTEKTLNLQEKVRVVESGESSESEANEKQP